MMYTSLLKHTERRQKDLHKPRYPGGANKNEVRRLAAAPKISESTLHSTNQLINGNSFHTPIVA